MSNDDDDIDEPVDLRLSIRQQERDNKSEANPHDVTSEEHLWKIVESFGSTFARAHTIPLLRCRLLERIANNLERIAEATDNLNTTLYNQGNPENH